MTLFTALAFVALGFLGGASIAWQLTKSFMNQAVDDAYSDGFQDGREANRLGIPRNDE